MILITYQVGQLGFDMIPEVEIWLPKMEGFYKTQGRIPGMERFRNAHHKLDIREVDCNLAMVVRTAEDCLSQNTNHLKRLW